MITIEIKDDEISAALARLSASLADMRPAMMDIGEALLRTTLQRFDEGVSPDGVPWAPKSPVTLRAYAAKGYGSPERPLFGPSGTLSSGFAYEASPYSLIFGTTAPSKDYAATMQFGAVQGSFGRTKRNGPIPWGNIPARPFLGFSDGDRENILDILNEYLESAATGGS